MTNLKVLIAVNTAWNLVNFREGLIRALVGAGYEVVVVAPYDEYAHQLPEFSCRYVPLIIDNKGTHPGRDMLLIWRFFRLFQSEKPDVFLGYTIKPNVYGSIAARSLGIPVINNITGLGTSFMKAGWLNYFVRMLYRFALVRSFRVFFQNNEDRQLFVSSTLVDKTVTDRLPGSGIDLLQFVPVPLPSGVHLRFLLIARMLRDKGVWEFVEAARILKQRGVIAEFCLLGFLDVKNPAAISRLQMDEWVAEGTIRYLGVSDNVREEIARANCVVLPSYREGTPRTLLEAAAMARPIITTDAVGCRDVVDEGVNGFLCRPKDAVDLAEKIAQMIALSAEERELMGVRGRRKIELKYDEQIVIRKYLEVINLILQNKKMTLSEGVNE